MFCVKDKCDFAILRSTYIRILRCHNSTITHHLLCKSFIRCSREVCCHSCDRTGNHDSLYNLLFFCFLCLNCCILNNLCFFCLCISVRSCFQIVFKVRLDHSDIRSVNNLNALSLVYHTGCSRCLKNSVIYSGSIFDCTTKSGCTAIHITDIFLTAKTSCNCFADGIIRSYCLCLSCLSAGIYICLCIKLCFCVIILTTRSFEIKLPDHKSENKII